MKRFILLLGATLSWACTDVPSGPGAAFELNEASKEADRQAEIEMEYLRLRYPMMDQTSDNGATCAAQCGAAGALLYQWRTGQITGTAAQISRDFSVVNCLNCTWERRDYLTKFLVDNLKADIVIYGSFALAYVGTAKCVYNSCWEDHGEHSEGSYIGDR